MYKYETHLHTYPVSRCARSSPREQLEFYKSLGYEGVFITNHFVGGNINIEHTASWEEKINFFFSDFEEAKKYEKEVGISVFAGAEWGYKGTDFLVYGLDKEWYLSHPELEDMKFSERLQLAIESGALIIHAHPFREAAYIDHIRLFPRQVHGAEHNASNSEFCNARAKEYIKNYGLIPFAGSDCHSVSKKKLAGMQSRSRIKSEKDFVEKTLARKLKPFTLSLEEE